jgi:hypothetical protein
MLTEQSESRARPVEERAAERRAISVPGRLTWRDAEGTSRFAIVRTRNVSDTGVLLECRSGNPIPLHRLVTFHVERSASERAQLPSALQRTGMSAAVYRVGPFQRATGAPDTYALRLLVKPDRRRGLAARTATLERAIRGSSVAYALPRPVPLPA